MSSDDAFIALPTDDQMRAQGYGTRPHPYDFGFIPGMRGCARRTRASRPRWGDLFREIMFAPGDLTRAEREMIAAVASAAQDCTY